MRMKISVRHFSPRVALATTLIFAAPHMAHAGAPYPGWRGQTGDTRALDNSRRDSWRAPPRDDLQDRSDAETIYVIEQKPPIWRGLYVGAHLGGDFGTVKAKGLGDLDADLSGLATGAFVGFDVALGAFVLGAEFDATWSLDDGDATQFGAARLASDIDWLSSARVRLGYTVGQFLFYGTGGLAFTNIETSIGFNGVTVKRDEARTGYVVGGGVDMELTSDVSVRVEALHYGFGTEDFTIDMRRLETETDLTTVRAGLTLHFN